LPADTLRVLIAPTAYKGTLSPCAVAGAIAAGARQSGRRLQLTIAPVADGGDGTVEALHQCLGGDLFEETVLGALGGKQTARWLRLPAVAVIELASACGIAGIARESLSPLYAHTYGLGQVIRRCLAGGERKLVVTVGGSASTDGGTGALRALGARFLDAAGCELPPGGGPLVDLHHCDLSALVRLQPLTELAVATDVQNPLLGDNGAAFVFGPQKGANRFQCLLLEQGLARLADLMEQATGSSRRNEPGAGAAGGAAFGLACALGARIIPGFQWIAGLMDLKEKVSACDLVIGGEGKLDRQLSMGKAVGELAGMCRQAGKPLWVLAAAVEPGVDWRAYGIEKAVAVPRRGEMVDREDLSGAARQLLLELP